MENEARQFRDKPTDIDHVIPAVSTWPAEKLRRFRFTNLDGEKAVLEPSNDAAKDKYPLPMPVDREGYAALENSDRYWTSGLADWLNVSQAMNRYATKKEECRLLDFGCASGRFLRHALLQANSIVEPWGCDLAPANINWIKRHLPGAINCDINSNEPPLPYNDNQFDLVTAFSVFTHIDQLEIEWLQELNRIVCPGGLLYLTVHNDASWKVIANRPATIKQFEHQNTFNDNLQITPAMMAGTMPQERMVFRKDHEPVYNCNVWHSSDYIRREWAKQFKILHIADNAHGNFQTPVILRAGN